jgi:hypothetical protein
MAAGVKLRIRQHKAAVDNERLPGGITGVIRTEPGHQARNLLVLPGLASGMFGIEPGLASSSLILFIGVAIAPGATAFTSML